MKGLRYILLMLLVPVVASGCATNGGLGPNTCALLGGGLGGVGGALIAERAIAGAVPGVVVGAVIGHMLCRDKDADKDGVKDSLDLCLDTPKGTAVNQNGCPDSDHDGVSDDADKCPGTPEGVAVNGDGCPPDSDSDGVADYIDECPNTLPNIEVEDNGCAKCGQLLASVANVNFDFNKAEIRAESTGTLAQVVNAIKNTNTAVRIEGYTDNIGSDSYNLDLSRARAQAASDYLTARGVSQDNISAVVGKGEADPIALNTTKEGRAQNRRVEISTDCSVQ